MSTKKNNLGHSAAYGVWVVSYGSTQHSVNSATILSIFQMACRGFELESGTIKGSFGPEKWPGRIQQLEPWLQDRLNAQAEIESRDLEATPQISLWRSGAQRVMWYLECTKFPQSAKSRKDNQADPALFMGIDLALARYDNSARVLVENVARILIDDPDIWYGFINLAPFEHVPHPAFYSSEKYTGLPWERLLEQAVWNEYALGDRSHVRGVFWGNIFGQKFAQRMRDAGYDQGVEQLRDEYGHEPVTLRAENGAMAVFLDNDPVGFAKKRDGDLDAMSRCVLTGAMLSTVLWRAGLL